MKLVNRTDPNVIECRPNEPQDCSHSARLPPHSKHPWCRKGGTPWMPLALGRWLKEPVDEATVTVESIAKRERCSNRKVSMTISLAFLAPNLVKAAIEGQLPAEWEWLASWTRPPS